jgi:hypothetical protein
MSGHLTSEELDRFARRAAPAQELLSMDDHLALCAECRSRLEGPSDLEHAASAMRGALRQRHLSEGEVEVCAGGGPGDVAAIEHVETCATCREEVDALRRYRAEVSRLPRQNRRRRAWQAAVAAAIAAAVLLTLTHRKPRVVPDILVGLRQEVEVALTRGAVQVPERIDRLRGGNDVLLGPVGADSAFGPASPKATATISDRPVFRWRPLENAESYRVSIFDEGLRKISASLAIKDTVWQPEASLGRGKVYLWQVSAKTKMGVVTAPAPPRPEARFEVLSAPEADRLRALQARYPGEHVVVGVALARSGALDEAADELAKASADARVARLLENLRKR